MGLDNKNSQPRILFLALSGIGNFIMQSPTFSALKKAWPNSHIAVWVAPRGTKILAENNEYIDEVIEATDKNSIVGHLKMTRQLYSKRFTHGIALSPGQLIKGATYLYLSGIPTRIGHSYPLGSNPHSSFLLTHSIPENPAIHDIEQNLNLLAPLEINTQAPYYTVSIPAEAQRKAAQLVDSYNLPISSLIGIHTGSAPNFLWKRWPLENFATVAKKVIDTQKAHILLFGGPDEKTQNETLQKMIGDHCTIIQSDLLTTAAIMQKCQYVLANDSGLMHLAAAAGVKTFGLFGPTNEKQTGPRGPQSHIIRATNTEPVYHTEKNHFLGDKPHSTILDITPELVLQQLEIS
jgi:ADP-heptose:LPS heptosyltransferase